MTAGGRTRRPVAGCLLAAVLLVLGLTGAAGAAAGTDADRPVVTSAIAGPGPHAVLPLRPLPRPATHRPGGDPAAPSAALVIVSLLAGWRRSPAARGVRPPTPRPAYGSRAPPARATPSRADGPRRTARG